MRLPPYPKYKPSDVEWLGDVPAHWEVKPLGRLGRFAGGATPDKGKPEYWDGDIPWVSPKDMKRMRVNDVPDHVSTEGLNSSALTLMPAQSVLIVVRGMILAHSFPVAITDAPVTINQDMKALTSGKRLNAEFLLWLLTGIAPVFVSLADESAHGTRKLESEVVARVCAPLPPTNEQISIIDFLDREAGKIDTLVAKKRTLIERLKEKRTALISRTVTRGLPPDAACAADLCPYPKLKPSDIDWFGEVPERWALLRIATESTKITNGYVGPTRGIFVDDGVPYLQSLHIKDNRIVFSRRYFVSREWSFDHSKSILAAGDVLIVQTGDIGQSAVVPAEFSGANCHALIIVSPRRDRLCGAFLSQYLNSKFGFHELKRIQTGALHPHLNCGLVRDIRIPVPPLREQITIVDFLEHETTKIDTLVTKIETAIERLQEYRTALITAAVTGKIDVRGAVAVKEDAA